MPDVTPIPKGQQPRKTPQKGRRARPDEPLAERCQARLEGCTGRATERHHLLPRSRGGTDDPSNTIDLCSADHAHIHAHTEWAQSKGWLRRPLPLPHKNPRSV